MRRMHPYSTEKYEHYCWRFRSRGRDRRETNLTHYVADVRPVVCNLEDLPEEASYNAKQSTLASLKQLY